MRFWQPFLHFMPPMVACYCFASHVYGAADPGAPCCDVWLATPPANQATSGSAQRSANVSRCTGAARGILTPVGFHGRPPANGDVETLGRAGLLVPGQGFFSGLCPRLVRGPYTPCTHACMHGGDDCRLAAHGGLSSPAKANFSAAVAWRCRLGRRMLYRRLQRRIIVSCEGRCVCVCARVRGANLRQGRRIDGA